MSNCKKFTDLISGKEHDYSEAKVAELKAKYNKQGLKRVALYKKYCVLGQIKHYNDYLIEQGIKKAPAKKAIAKGKKSPPKKVKLPKCVDAGCPSGKACNVKSGRCVKNKPTGAKKIEIAGEEFFVTSASQEKKVENAKGAKASPAKPRSRDLKKGTLKKSPKKKVKVSPKKKTPKKKSPGKKSPPKKVKVPKCVDAGCGSGTTCNVKSGRCVKNKPKGADLIEVGGEEFFVSTASQKKKVEDFKGKKASPHKPHSRDLKKVSVPKRKVSPKKKSPTKKGKKSPPKKVKVHCLDTGCPSGKTCNVKTGNCVKGKPKGAEKYEFGGDEFFVTTSSQKKKVRDTVGSVSAARESSRQSSLASARTPSPLLERLSVISAEMGDEADYLSEELSEELGDLSEDVEEDLVDEDPATVSREDVANINAQKKMILNILEKCQR